MSSKLGRRLEGLCTHIAPRSANSPHGGLLSSRSAALLTEGTHAVDDDWLVEDAARAAARRPLSSAQVEQFVRDGFLILQINDVEPEAHRSIFTAAHRSHRGPVTEAALQRMEQTTGWPRHPEAALPMDSTVQPTADEIQRASAALSAVSRSEVLLGAVRECLPDRPVPCC